MSSSSHSARQEDTIQLNATGLNARAPGPRRAAGVHSDSEYHSRNLEGSWTRQRPEHGDYSLHL